MPVGNVAEKHMRRVSTQATSTVAILVSPEHVGHVKNPPWGSSMGSNPETILRGWAAQGTPKSSFAIIPLSSLGQQWKRGWWEVTD